MVEQTQDKKYKKYLAAAGWILFLILFSMILGAIFIPKLVHASTTWPLNQSQTCDMFNKTGIYCDAYWCQNFTSNNTQNCVYDLIGSKCNCLQINNTIIPSLNNTNTTLINCSSTNITLADWNTNCNKTINCSSTNITLADFNSYCINISNSTNINDWKNYTDSQLIALKLSLMERMQNDSLNSQIHPCNDGYKAEYGINNTISCVPAPIPPDPWPWYAYAFIALIIIGGFGGIIYYIEQARKKDNIVVKSVGITPPKGNSEKI